MAVHRADVVAWAMRDRSVARSGCAPRGALNCGKWSRDANARIKFHPNSWGEYFKNYATATNHA